MVGLYGKRPLNQADAFIDVVVAQVGRAEKLQGIRVAVVNIQRFFEETTSLSDLAILQTRKARQHFR